MCLLIDTYSIPLNYPIERGVFGYLNLLLRGAAKK